MKYLFPSFVKLFICLIIIGLGITAVLHNQPDSAKAVGNFTVTFPSNPFFSETNLAPGAVITKTLTVKNDISVPRMAAVKATHVTRSAGSPNLDDILTLEIKDGATVLLSAVPLSSFLNNNSPDGIQLNIINPGVTKNYTFKVTFPQSADNTYQNRSVQFDVTVGSLLGNDLVINEAFFRVDPAHGVDCSGKSNGNCDEWVELFNPTDQEISLKNWLIIDGSGTAHKVNANKKIKANGFALLVKSNSTFARYWKVPKNAQVVELGQFVGNGLDHTGDRLQLVNPAGLVRDSISWGSDGTNPHYGLSTLAGHSIERSVPGFDTDAGTDFIDKTPPTPGS
jgi:hypothetical protein